MTNHVRTDQIETRRLKLLEALLDPVRRFLEYPKALEQSICSQHRELLDEEHTSVLETAAVKYQRTLGYHGLYPLPTPSSCKHSAGFVYQLLKDTEDQFRGVWAILFL